MWFIFHLLPSSGCTPNTPAWEFCTHRVPLVCCDKSKYMKMDFHPCNISELAKWYTHYCKYCPKNVVVISDVARGLDPWGQAGSLRTTHTTTGQDTHPRTGRREQVEKSKEGRIMVSRGIAGMSFQDNAVEASISVRLWAVQRYEREVPNVCPSQCPPNFHYRSLEICRVPLHYEVLQTGHHQLTQQLAVSGIHEKSEPHSRSGSTREPRAPKGGSQALDLRRRSRPKGSFEHQTRGYRVPPISETVATAGLVTTIISDTVHICTWLYVPPSVY